MLEWMRLRGINPSQNGVYSSISYGQLDVLTWMVEKGNRTYMNDHSANCAATSGHLDILEWLALPGILPGIPGMYHAEINGYSHILRWMEQHNIRPTTKSVNTLAENGYLNILQWLGQQRNSIHQQKEPIEPSLNNHIHVLDWLSEKGILPNRDAATQALDTNRIQVLEWLKGKGIFPILPIPWD